MFLFLMLEVHKKTTVEGICIVHIFDLAHLLVSAECDFYLEVLGFIRKKH